MQMDAANPAGGNLFHDIHLQFDFLKVTNPCR